MNKSIENLTVRDAIAGKATEFLEEVIVNDEAAAAAIAEAGDLLEDYMTELVEEVTAMYVERILETRTNISVIERPELVRTGDGTRAITPESLRLGLLSDKPLETFLHGKGSDSL